MIIDDMSRPLFKKTFSVAIQLPFCRYRLLSNQSTTPTTVSTAAKESAPTAIKERKVNGIINDQATDTKKTALRVLSSCSLLSLFGYCIYTRRKRERQLIDLPLARDCGLFYVGNESADINTNNSNNNYKGSNKNNKLRRDLHVLETIIARNGLMGKQTTVKEELDDIRSWHQNHGYKGGVVLRDLSTNLYELEYEALEGGDDVEVESTRPEKIRQRECYYLYYEIKPNGQTLHQIFCRGTTISDDVFTCLQSHLVYDQELKIRIHSGFLEHANRLIDDALPLLGPPHTIRSIVEVSGHSLGGAVAYIVSMKLKKRGYNVSKVTAVAGARFCHPEDVKLANNLLPKDALRVEDDLDIVPFLPAWANAVGDKLWLTSKLNNKNDSSPFESKYITRDALQQGRPFSWVDGWWENVRLPEMLYSVAKVHRIFSYRSKIKNLIDTMKEAEEDFDVSSSNGQTMEMIEKNPVSGQ